MKKRHSLCGEEKTVLTCVTNSSCGSDMQCAVMSRRGKHHAHDFRHETEERRSFAALEWMTVALPFR